MMNPLNCSVSNSYLCNPSCDCITAIGLSTIVAAAGPYLYHSCTHFSGPGLWSIGAGAGAGCLFGLCVSACAVPVPRIVDREIALAPDPDSSGRASGNENAPVTIQPGEMSPPQNMHSNLNSEYRIYNDGQSGSGVRCYLESEREGYSGKTEIPCLPPYPDTPPPAYSEIAEAPPAYNPDHTRHN